MPSSNANSGTTSTSVGHFGQSIGMLVPSSQASTSTSQSFLDNQQASRRAQEQNQRRMLPVPLQVQPHFSTATSTASGSSASSSNAPVDFALVMRSRGHVSSSTSHSSISSSTSVNIDESKARILNPEGKNSPANSLRLQDFEMNWDVYDLLMNKSPRMAGHSGKNRTTNTTYIYVTDGNRCFLQSVDKHLHTITALVYARMSERGIIGPPSENKHFDEVRSLLMAVENTAEYRFHEIMTPSIALILTHDTEYVKKWGQMGHCFLQTLRNKLNNSEDGR